MINILRMDSATSSLLNASSDVDVIIGPESLRKQTTLFPFAIFLPNDDRTWSNDEAEIAYNKSYFSLGVDNE